MFMGVFQEDMEKIHQQPTLCTCITSNHLNIQVVVYRQLKNSATQPTWDNVTIGTHSTMAK